MNGVPVSREDYALKVMDRPPELVVSLSLSKGSGCKVIRSVVLKNVHLSWASAHFKGFWQTDGAMNPFESSFIFDCPDAIAGDRLLAH